MDPTPERPRSRPRRASHWTGTHTARPMLPAILPALLTAMLWTLPGAPAGAATHPQAPASATAPPRGVAVYRCRDAKGGIEFRDAPCPQGTGGETLVVEDHPIGWTPAPMPRRTETGRKTKAGPDAGQAKARASARSARERREENCHKKRQQVEDINRKLRAGVKVRKGVELQHRREAAEEYLDTHCD